MALAKKGSRRITIEGVTYRWIVGPNDGFMTLYVELVTQPGRRLEAMFGYHDLYQAAGPGAWRVVGQRRTISPGIVRRVILAALAGGWRPSERVPRAFRMADADQLVPVTDRE